MAEHVTRVEGVEGQDIGRLVDFAARFPGGQGEVRADRRSADAAFEFFAAARGRYPIHRVLRHVCRHDEGEGDCSQAVIEG